MHLIFFFIGVCLLIFVVIGNKKENESIERKRSPQARKAAQELAKREVIKYRCPYCDDGVEEGSKFCISCGGKINIEQDTPSVSIGEVFIWPRGDIYVEDSEVTFLVISKWAKRGRDGFELWVTTIDNQLEPFIADVKLSFILTHDDIPFTFEQLSREKQYDWLFDLDEESFIQRFSALSSRNIFAGKCGITISRDSFEKREYAHCISDMGFSYTYNDSILWVQETITGNFPVCAHVWILTPTGKILYKSSIPVLWDQ